MAEIGFDLDMSVLRLPNWYRRLRFYRSNKDAVFLGAVEGLGDSLDFDRISDCYMSAYCFEFGDKNFTHQAFPFRGTQRKRCLPVQDQPCSTPCGSPQFELDRGVV